MFWINVRLDERNPADKVRIHIATAPRRRCRPSDAATAQRYWVGAFQTYAGAAKWVSTNLAYPAVPCGNCNKP